MTEILDATFGEAYKTMKSYPASGSRDSNDGVPSRPTLARYAAAEVLGEDPFGSPINSESRTVLATLLKMVDDLDESVPEIIEAHDSAQDLRDAVEEAVLGRFPSAEEAEFKVTGSVNHTAPAIAAIAAVSYEVDPIEAVRNHLEDETVELGWSGDEEQDED